jgi:hypothetical protein
VHKLDSGAVVEESYYAIKGGPPQIKREGDEVRSIQEWLKLINLFRIIGNIDISTESELLEVKVPMAFLITARLLWYKDGLKGLYFSYYKYNYK